MIFLEAFFFLTFLSALRDISTKHSLKSIDPDVLAGYTALGICFLIFPFLVLVGFPSFSWELFLVSFLSGILYFSFKYLNYTALSLGDISYISPLKGLITVSIIGTEYILLSQIPNSLGILGIITIFIGTYIVAIQSKKTSFFDPIKRLFTDKASQLFLGVIIITAFTTVLDKIGTGLSNPFFWAFTMQFFIMTFSLQAMIRKKKIFFSALKKNSLSFFITIILNSITLIAQLYIVLQIYVSYTSAFKTASSIISVLIGGWFFKEKDLKIRFVGALVIFFGILLISFSDKIIAFLKTQI